MGDPRRADQLIRAPGPALRPFVRTLWASLPSAPRPGADAPAPQREAVLPSGTMHVVFRLEGPPLRLFTDDDPRGQPFEPAVVGGARSSAYVKDISEPAGSVGAELMPGAAEILLGVPAGELAERHTALSAVLGPAAHAIHARLLEARGPEARLDLLEAFLRARLPARRALHPAIAGALARFAHGGLDAFHGLLDVGDHSAAHAIALGLAHSEDLDLPLLILAPDDAGDLRRSDIKSGDDILIVVHVLGGVLERCSFGAYDLVGEAHINAPVTPPVHLRDAFRVEKAKLLESGLQIGTVPHGDALTTDAGDQFELTVQVHDHLIVGRQGVASFKQLGLM